MNNDATATAITGTAPKPRCGLCGAFKVFGAVLLGIVLLLLTLWACPSARLFQWVAALMRRWERRCESARWWLQVLAWPLG